MNMLIEVQFQEGGSWFTTSVTPEEYEETIRSGQISCGFGTSKTKITAVKLGTVEEGNDEVQIIYDFIINTFRLVQLEYPTE